MFLNLDYLVVMIDRGGRGGTTREFERYVTHLLLLQTDPYIDFLVFHPLAVIVVIMIRGGWITRGGSDITQLKTYISTMTDNPEGRLSTYMCT